MLFLFVLLLKTTISIAEEETKPDPYFIEWSDTAWKRPSQCHVCRLLVTELYIALNGTNKRDILRTGYSLDDKKKEIAYKKSEVRLIETMEKLCDTMLAYVSRARRKFPYVKGVKSHFREGVDNLIKNSKAKLHFQMPDDMVNDSTKEINRLQFKCVHMIEEYEDDITEWFMEHSDVNLMDWLCKDRVLKNQENDCLSESDELFVPENDTIATLTTDEEEDQNDVQESHVIDSNNENLISDEELERAPNEDFTKEEFYNNKENFDDSDVHLGL